MIYLVCGAVTVSAVVVTGLAVWYAKEEKSQLDYAMKFAEQQINLAQNLREINIDLMKEAARATRDRDEAYANAAETVDKLIRAQEELAQERADREIKDANRLIRKRKGALAGWEKRRERAA